MARTANKRRQKGVLLGILVAGLVLTALGMLSTPPTYEKVPGVWLEATIDNSEKQTGGRGLKSSGRMSPKMHPVRPLQQEYPVMVQILAYQRTASSVIGNLLGDIEGHFYLYEPLDMTFNAMYGTDPGWNIPADIFNDPNTGRIRRLYKDELKAIHWTMDSIYQCKMADQWPLQFLIYPFWFNYLSSAMQRYKRCITVSEPRVNKTTLTDCLSKLSGICKGHYNSKSDKLKRCKTMFWRDGRYVTSFDWTQVNKTASGFSFKELKGFEEYFKCMKVYEKTTRECARKWFDEPCEKSNIRVIKTVRADMSVPERFFRSYPNYRLVHLFRDPRGAVKSRMDSHWSQGLYESKNLSRVAEAYCHNVLSDYKLRLQLEAKYPGQTAQIISDDFMVHSLDYVDDMAQLIGKDATSMKAKLKGKLKLRGIGVEGAEDHSSILQEMNERFHLNSTRLSSKRQVPRRGEKSPMLSRRNLFAHAQEYAPTDQPVNKMERKRRMPLHDIFNLGLKNPLDFLSQMTRPQDRKGESRLRNWQDVLLWKEVKEIERLCKDFFATIPYDWNE